jgi:hypothetical protein
MMTDANPELNFLWTGEEDFRESFRAMYQELISRFEEEAHKANSVISAMEVNSADGPGLMSACLFLRMLEVTRGSFLLAERGFSSPAKSLLRDALELMIRLKLLHDDPSYFHVLLKRDNHELKTLISKDNLACIEGSTTASFAAVVSEQRESLDEMTRSMDPEIKCHTLQRLAELAGMTPQYNIIYRLLCSDTHGSPRSLTGYVQRSPSGNIKGLQFGPSVEDAEALISTLADLLALSCRLFLSSVPAS